MGENLTLAGREAIRTPMQWESGRSAGFSTAAHDALVRPLTRRGPYGPGAVNVGDQRRRQDSLLRWFEELIRVLRECPEIGVGSLALVNGTFPRSVLAHRFDAPEGSLLLLHNLADKPVRVDVDGASAGSGAYEVFADADYEALRPRDLSDLALNGWGYRWIRLRRGAG